MPAVLMIHYMKGFARKSMAWKFVGKQQVVVIQMRLLVFAFDPNHYVSLWFTVSRW